MLKRLSILLLRTTILYTSSVSQIQCQFNQDSWRTLTTELVDYSLEGSEDPLSVFPGVVIFGVVVEDHLGQSQFPGGVPEPLNDDPSVMPANSQAEGSVDQLTKKNTLHLES